MYPCLVIGKTLNSSRAMKLGDFLTGGPPHAINCWDVYKMQTFYESSVGKFALRENSNNCNERQIIVNYVQMV